MNNKPPKAKIEDNTVANIAKQSGIEVLEFGDFITTQVPEQFIKIDFDLPEHTNWVKLITGSPAEDFKLRLQHDALKNIKVNDNIFLVSKKEMWLFGYIE